jgi:hypothetical protein
VAAGWFRHRRGGARFLAKVYRKLGGTWPLSLAVEPAKSRASTLTVECHGVTLHERGVFPEGALDRSDADAFAAEIQEALAALTDPDGQHVFASAKRREEVYHGPRTPEAAHILLGPDSWGVAAAIKALKNIPFVSHRTGIHSSEGIFLGAGPALSQGRLPARAVNLLDVAPLIFHLLGEPIPEGLDGRLLPELFASGRLAADPPRYAPVDLPDRTREALDAEAIQEKLRGLGYMG